ncbi:MAG TPA: DMT family transporter [Niallia sp.]|nr:DMT family transporter [Niallia sp.]
MKGIIFAFLGGAFITLQGVANATISQDVGTWQAATITQFTGFVLAFIILLIVKEQTFAKYKQVKPIYLAGGSFAAIIIASNITAIHLIGATLNTSIVLISQLFITFLIDSYGLFGLEKQKMKTPQFIGIAMMIAGVLLLKM